MTPSHSRKTGKLYRYYVATDAIRLGHADCPVRSVPAAEIEDAVGDAWSPAKPRPDETLIRALARAHRWKQLIEDGAYRSAVEIAEAEGVTRSFVNRLLRLSLLAPDIVERSSTDVSAEGPRTGAADK